ncbi:MAG: hypothetical protein WCC04_16790, partial [Terriglobales bacterium]
MSLCQTYRRWAALALVLALFVIALPTLLNAQTAPAPKASSVQSSDNTVPDVELFVGYQWLNPGGNVPDQETPPNAIRLPSMAKGAGISLSYNFNKYMSVEGYGGKSENDYASINTFAVGPKLTWRGEGVNFFVHTLLGVESLTPNGISSSRGMAAILGGGMDLKIWKPISLRLFEADFQWSQQHFANEVSLDNGSLRRPGYYGALLRTGLIFNFGGAPPVPVAAACSIDHAEVMVGEPLHVTVAGSNFNPKHTLTYTWASNGGKIEGKDTGATIDTNGAAPGSYTATATVTDAKAHNNNTASCSSNFTVKPLNPPQVSCSASPSTVDAGTSATITCTCTSPDNVPVTVGGWSATGGAISGSGNSATLNTTGASPGTITINATCTDSRGLNASASSSVSVNVPPPPPPPPPQASKLNACDYPNVKKPWRVDNTC